MGQAIHGGASSKVGISEVEKLANGIVLTDVVIKKREIIVDIPKVIVTDVNYERPVLVDKEYERPVIKDVIKETIRYNVKEQETIQFVPKLVECEKPVIVTKEYEKPIIREQIYEKPIIEQKKIEVVSVDSLDAINNLVYRVEQLNKAIPELLEKLVHLVDYKLVEKVINVPKVEYHTVKVERIEWVPIKKEVPIAD